MLIGIKGKLGAGKTLAMTFLGYLAQQKYGTKIASNYKTTFSDQYITTLKQFESFKNGIMLLDELWLWIDSRRSGSDKNMIVNKIPLASRKRGLIIIYTSQQIGQTDLRIRGITDLIIEPTLTPLVDNSTGKLIYDSKGFPLSICTLHIFGAKVKKISFLANSVYDLYDTNEEVLDLKTTNNSLKAFMGEF